MGELTLRARQMDRAAWGRLISQLMFGLALLLMLGHLIVYVVYAVGLMRFPFDYDQGEGFELVDTVMFSKGEWPYQNNEVYPFYASNYPPLFHVLLVPFVWIFGPEYWYGRLIGFLGTLLTAGAIGWAVYREERHRLIAILSGLAFLASNYVYHVGPLFRQHMTMVLFETLAVVVLAHVLDNKGSRHARRTMIIGLLLLLAAGYTKQHAVATAAAVFGFMFVRSPRRSIGWGLVFAAVGGGLFLWINWATDGQWWANIISANVNQYIPSQFTGLFRQWFRLHWTLIFMAGLLAVYELYFARLSLYSVWWVMALASTVLSGKWGAGDSYFATTIAATCLLAGLFASRTVHGVWTFPADHPYIKRLGHLPVSGPQLRLAASLIIPALYLVYGLTVVHLPTRGSVFGPLTNWLGLESSYGARYAFYDSAGWVPGYATIGHIPTQTDIDNGWRIVDILRDSDKPAMSEEAGFSLRAGKDVITNPTQLKNLYENGLFDPANLIRAIQQEEFSVVVFRAQFYPPPVVEAVFEAYYRAEDIVMNGFSYQIWRPGPPQLEREAFTSAVTSLEPGQAKSLVISLPYSEAVRWTAHALWHQNWQQIETREDDPCSDLVVQQGDKRLKVTICPFEREQAELTFSRE